MPEVNQANMKADPARAKATSLATINKLIVNIGRSATKLNDTIHNTALLCLEHARNFGDVTPSANLVDALPLSHRRSLLINWFSQFSPITISKDGKTNKMKGHLKGTADERKNLWMAEEAKATPFFALPEAEREPEVPTFESLHNNIIAFVKRVEKRVDDIQDEGEKARAADEVQKLKAAVA